PECLRAFSLSVGAADFVIHRTGCVYCGTSIHYATVQPMNSTLPHSYPRCRQAQPPLWHRRSSLRHKSWLTLLPRYTVCCSALKLSAGGPQSTPGCAHTRLVGGCRECQAGFSLCRAARRRRDVHKRLLALVAR